MTYFEGIPHNTEEENMEAHSWNYYFIFNFSKKNAGCIFTLQTKHQYLEIGSNLLGLLDKFVYHSFFNLK